jgi:hypothetical protein
VDTLKTKTPTGLKPGGKRLWSSIVDEFDLRADELRVLEDACRESDLVDALQAELAKGALTVLGSQGQPVANPMVAELRQHRAVFQRLVASLKLPESDDGRSAAAQRSTSARAAANARWSTNRGA